jgi:FG-GAP-like repeat
VTSPHVPFPPATGARPYLIGNGNDATPNVSGLISTATGSFDSVVGVTSETNAHDEDKYSLQLNSNYFYGSPACSGARDPTKCQGWQQFVFSNYIIGGGEMQYWLLNYHNTCPDGWWASGTDCYTDSPTVQTPHQPITNLANLSVTGQTVAGGQDTFILSTGSALYAVQNSDSMLGLPNYWKSAEFNVFGDCCSSTAYFNSGSTIAVRTSVDSGVTTAPSCINDGWTGEQNNLYFQASSGTPRSSTQPAIVFTESTTETRTKPCDSAVAVPAASKLADTHDFNGDGFSDIVWSGTSGDIAVWLMNGAEVMLSGTPGTAQSTWSIVGQRDFNGDGTYDFLWRDSSGNTSIWFMVGTQVFSTGTIGNIPTTWSLAGVADFNGDGKGDILWRDSSGNTAVWLMNGASVLSTGSLGNIPTSFSVAGTGDFNGDGDADILWQDGSGNYSIWFMNGTAVTSTAAVGSVSTTWSVVGTGDFNADGKTDIAWRDASGDTAIWLMNGASVLSSGGIGTVPTTWSVALTGDFNGDGMSDLLWQDTSGDTAIWFMNGTAVLSTASLGNISSSWTLQSVNAD